MESKLKFKTPDGAIVNLDVDITYPIVLSVNSNTAESSVSVNSPDGTNATVEFIGGREKRG